MIAALLLLQAAACTPAQVAKDTPAGWASPADAANGGALAIGRAATVALVTGARPAVAPGKPGAASASLGFVVPRAGRWRVSLDSGVWVDVVRDGRAVASAAHGHGAACGGVRKRVEFELGAGRYVLQLSGAAGVRVRAMVSPA